MKRGYVQVYTGNGKGKTTAALGLALRAAGAGLRVFIAQFIKQKVCSEHRMLREFGDRITVLQFGKGFILKRKPGPADARAAQQGLEAVVAALQSREYDVVILDEANVAVHYDLLSADDLLQLMETKPRGTELVITGRYADERVIERADLVTEMREIKHYKSRQVRARVGIEK